MRLIRYAGRRLTIRELAAVLALPPQAASWRVDHWPSRRWGEPLVWRMKLNLEMAREMRARKREGPARLAREFDVTPSRVGRVLKGLSWKE
jgi:hypothetical protein